MRPARCWVKAKSTCACVFSERERRAERRLRVEAERFLDVLPGLQVRVLFALAPSPRGLNTHYTQAHYGLPEGGAAHDAREALIRRGEVLADPYRITDPLLRHWLSQRRRPSEPEEHE